MGTKTLRIKHRVDTSENWKNNNPILLNKEIGYERETGNFKIGDGTNNYNELSYYHNIENGKGKNSIQQQSCNAILNNSTALGYNSTIINPKCFIVTNISNNKIVIEGLHKNLIKTKDKIISFLLSNEELQRIDAIVVNTTEENNTTLLEVTIETAETTYNDFLQAGFIIINNGTDGTNYLSTINNFNFPSFAEGYKTLSNLMSHSEGFKTEANGVFSHVEGAFSRADGRESHAEGRNTIASGYTAHTEGGSTVASGEYSHAEGANNQATAWCAHAEGYNTNSNSSSSHTEGNGTKALSTACHAEGFGSKASGYVSHAEGYYTESSGGQSHSEGYYTKADGQYSHSEGFHTQALGSQSHSEGDSTVAKGSSSHAAGKGTIASGKFQFAYGQYNIEDTTNKYVTIIGDGTDDKNRSNIYTCDWNGNIWTKGDVLIGEDNISIKNKLAEKQVGQFSNSTSEIFNDYENNQASSMYTHAEGSNTKASGYSSHSEGLFTTASSEACHSEGKNSIASGYVSHAEGYGTTASAAQTHAEGNATTAAGQGSHSEGKQTKANGSYSHTEGDNTVAGSHFQHVQGKFNQIDTSNKYAHIVGGGTSETDRKNIHTIDWNGNIWFAGDIEDGSGNKLSEKPGKKTTEGGEIFNKYVSIDPVVGMDSTETNAASWINTAGLGSHAEGASCADGKYSHAEGYMTYADGWEGAHAEGYNTTAKGWSSHAEGKYSTAEGEASHAEGDSVAIGTCAHSEGYATYAQGDYSHTEGYNTEAHANYQHVEGKFNIKDEDGKYLHIIGNGTDETHRANALTVDTEGNLWCKGTIKCGGNNYTEGTEPGGIITINYTKGSTKPSSESDSTALVGTIDFDVTKYNLLTAYGESGGIVQLIPVPLDTTVQFYKASGSNEYLKVTSDGKLYTWGKAGLNFTIIAVQGRTITF